MPNPSNLNLDSTALIGPAHTITPSAGTPPKDDEKPVPLSRPTWWNTVEQNSASAGVDASVLWRISGAEGSHQNAGKNPLSSASGPFQITRGTWDGVARAHPDLNLTNRLDPDQQARAAPWLLRAKNAVIEANLGRKPNATESYLGWFVGESDASKVLKADPSTPLSALVRPESIQSNPSVFRRARTAGDLIAWSGLKMGDASYKNSVLPAAVDTVSDTGHINISTSEPQQTETWKEAALAQDARDKDTYSASQAAYEAFKWESAATNLFDIANTPKPDPNFTMTQDILKKDPRLTEVPLKYQADLMQSRSQAEYDYRVKRLQDDLEYERKFANMGLGGTVLRMGAAMADPFGWAAAAALTPIGGAAVKGYKLGRIGRAFVAGLEGAGAAVAQETPIALNKPTYEREQMLYTGAGGLLFGTALGHLGVIHPALKDEVEGLNAASSSLMRDVERTIPSESSAGAAQNLAHVEPVRPDAYEFASDLFTSKEAQKSALGRLRFDLSGTTKNSDNPLVSALGGRLVEDAVGNADTSVAVNRAVSVEATQLRLRNEMWLAGEYKANATEYQKRLGIGWRDWTLGGKEAEFRRSISDAIENVDPTLQDSFDPAVAKQAGMQRRFYDAYLELAQNPGILDGTVKRPVPGTENLKTGQGYVPHIYDFQAFGETVRRFGDSQMVRLLERSVSSHLPELETGVARKVAKSLYKGLRNVEAGQETSMSRALSGDDAEHLRSLLRDGSDMDDTAINSIVEKLKPSKTEEGTISRTKRRTPLNPLYSETLKDVNTGEMVPVAMKDFMERDAVKVAQMYNRQMSAQVALSRLQIENPRWHPDDGPEGRYLVDGIQGASDWEKVRAQVFATADHLGLDKVQTEKDWERLDFIHKSISGTVHKTDKGKLGSFLRVLRDYNFMRVMNQVGFAQVGDVGVMVSQVGWKAALSNMPSLRGVMRDMKTGQMSLADAREMEWAFAPGTDWIRGATHLHADDFGNVMHERGAMGVAEELAQRGTRITSAISGMAPVNAYIQRWAVKAALAKFVDASEGATVLNAKRMRVLGITADEQERIFAQIKKHRGPVTDQDTGLTRTLLHLDQWDDAGARHAFEYGIFTWSRKMIQENDLGQMTTVLGTTMGKLMFQFRMFMLAGYTKNTLHNVHMRDWESMSNVLASSVLSGLAFSAQRYLQAQGRSDKDEFLAKHLNPKAIAAASFSRAGYSSLAPMLADVGTYALGMDPLFDTRVTGSPSQGLLSNPTMSLFDNGLAAIRGGAGALQGKPYKQKDARAAIGTLPFSNALPMVWMANQMVRNLPEH